MSAKNVSGARQTIALSSESLSRRRDISPSMWTRHWQAGPGFVMPWIIGFKKARELLYLGDTIDAQTALDLGMVKNLRNTTAPIEVGRLEHQHTLRQDTLRRLPVGAVAADPARGPRTLANRATGYELK